MLYDNGMENIEQGGNIAKALQEVPPNVHDLADSIMTDILSNDMLEKNIETGANETLVDQLMEAEIDKVMAKYENMPGYGKDYVKDALFPQVQNALEHFKFRSENIDEEKAERIRQAVVAALEKRS